MVKSFHNAAPQFGMLAPPPMLWLSNLPVPSFGRLNHSHKAVFGASPLTSLRANDPLTLKAMTAANVPSVVLALDDKSSTTDDEGSLSDTSSYRDAPTMPHFSVRRTYRRGNTNGTAKSRIKLAVPPGRPLPAKPRLVGASFLNTRKSDNNKVRRAATKAAVPLKTVISKARMAKRSSLSQDEKLFVEAAASLVQAK